MGGVEVFVEAGDVAVCNSNDEAGGDFEGGAGGGAASDGVLLDEAGVSCVAADVFVSEVRDLAVDPLECAEVLFDGLGGAVVVVQIAASSA